MAKDDQNKNDKKDGAKAAVEFALTGMLANMSMKMCDDFVDKNASVASKAGLVAILIRETHGTPCEFCAELAGRYDYENRPSGIRSRHKGCQCTIDFKTERRNSGSSVWRKPDSTAKARRIEVDLKEREKPIDNKLAKQYNNSPSNAALKKQYRKDVNDGWISPLFSEDQYVELYHDLQEQVVGLKTANGLMVTNVSAHFMARMIGTSRDPKIYAKDHKIVHRSGVEMKDIIDAVTEGRIYKFTDNETKGPSVTLFGKRAQVTVNTLNGTLIQCNLIRGK